ncbi:EAL domain-containing protein [Bacillus sp. DTU_2020_1000418_1_SI_GHA_SEK_038]|uniref:EAL domain-containing protein n=1 Tax=Bacillus sp. DTU_2020_1000418_1_SI_GHA_SEK_038 TaxID=3077585 RepID=UPI0028E7E2D9|nr:EAL domain-containing protein [Bacillus sp. DTU_2020_1000418_1_SI_GHA_SEK_038]WNS74616.1 EAL domain-containing protein [Bacillus sp. DTU_2020_1000418_1_SI_GHA_SEK_038]
MYSEYQPLLNSSNDTIFAHEALMRTTPRMNPLIVLEKARDNGILFELDTYCIKNAVIQYPSFYLKSHLLFINILPTTIVHHDFESFINKLLHLFPTIRGQIVFEINEEAIQKNIWAQQIFMSRLLFLKSNGFQIAFDDLPVTKDSFKMIEIISPDFVKLDHTKSKGLSVSIEKQALVSLFLEFTNKEIKLVLEGIETKNDLLAAKQLGVPILQGYYISKPKRL